jgi:ribosomal protein S12 methylthiotransferase accessory factor YcaO
LTTDIGVPCFEVYLTQSVGLNQFHAHHGFGCHKYGSVALARGLTEACQSRLAYFAGAREDVRGGVELAETVDRIKADWSSARETGLPVESKRHQNASDLLNSILKSLKRVSLSQVFVTNHAIPNWGLAAVGCFVPGLESPFVTDNDGGVYVGTRMQNAIAKNGIRSVGY